MALIRIPSDPSSASAAHTGHAPCIEPSDILSPITPITWDLGDAATLNDLLYHPVKLPPTAPVVGLGLVAPVMLPTY